MDIKAIMLVGGERGRREQATGERLAGVPFACLDVLGHVGAKSEWLQTLQRFASFDLQLLIDDARTADAAPFCECPRVDPHVSLQPRATSSGKPPEKPLSSCAEDGADLVLVLRVGPYVELDYEEIIQHHLDNRCRMTTVPSIPRATAWNFRCGRLRLAAMPPRYSAAGCRSCAATASRSRSRVMSIALQHRRRLAPPGARRLAGEKRHSSARQGE